MGALVFLDDLAEGQGVQLASPEGGWRSGTGKPLGPASAGQISNFVYRPGAAANSGNVFKDWSALVAALNGVQGIRTVLVDPFNTGDIGPTVPAGTWAVNDVLFYGQLPTSGFFPPLTFEDGAKLTGTAIYFTFLVLQSNSSSAVVTYSGGLGGVLSLLNCGLSSATSPFVHVAGDAGTVTLILAGFSEMGDGTNSAMQVDAPASSANLNVLEQAIVFANATSGTGTLNLALSPGGEVDAPQIAGLITTLLGRANQVTYTAAVVANWSGTNPTSVANALDRIAAKIGPIA